MWLGLLALLAASDPGEFTSWEFAHGKIIILQHDKSVGCGGGSRMTNPGVGMPCPVCAVPLVMSDRQGVEIDYCPQCRGVWLDRGELDKIIERSRGPEPTMQAAPRQQGYAQPPAAAPWGHDQHGYRKGYPKRRKSFLEELFD